jgi:sec-independent protein translocase protein TatA
MDIGPVELLIVLVVILVLFGGSQLPKLARGLGSAQREFKKGLEEGAAGDDAAKKSEKSKSD